MSTYILQSGLFLLAFWLIYMLFLKRETFFTYNRIYLLATPILAAVLPLFKINLFESYTEKAQEILVLPAVFIGKNKVEITPVNTSTLSETIFIQEHFLSILYGTGLLLMLAFFVRKLLKFQQFAKQGKAKRFEDDQWVEVPNTKVACTFFHTIYLGSELSEKEKQHILKHERTHANQRHTYDLLYFELLKIVSWFNPVVFFYQYEINQVHEYIADQQATKDTDKLPYYQSLLNLAFGSSNISFINQFFTHSLIKKRIMMLEKPKSTKTALLKFLVLIPAIVGMLFAVSCSDENVKEDSAVAEINHQESLDKYWEEITEMKENGKGINEISKAFYVKNFSDKSTPSPEEYYRHMTFMKYIDKEFNNSVEEGKERKEFKIMPYEEYLKNREEIKNMLPPPPPPSPFEGNEIPFTAIDKAPIFPGCESLEKEEQKKCLVQKISDLVNSNFDTTLGEKLDLEGINRVYVKFKINKEGVIEDIKARAPHPDLALEAERVIKMLPQMTPGEHEGKKAGVVYSLPIVFEVK